MTEKQIETLKQARDQLEMAADILGGEYGLFTRAKDLQYAARCLELDFGLETNGAVGQTTREETK